MIDEVFHRFDIRAFNASLNPENATKIKIKINLTYHKHKSINDQIS